MNTLRARLNPSSAALLVVDMQERLLPVIHDGESIIQQTRKMIDAAVVLGIPLVLTEQYPKGLGPTCAALKASLGTTEPIEKTRFTACVDAAVIRLRDLGRRQVLIAGIEAHICVQQTVLDLLRMDYQPWLCADATSSRRPIDCQIALDRMRQAGAIVTTVESAIFEMLDEAADEKFRQVLKIIK